MVKSLGSPMWSFVSYGVLAPPNVFIVLCLLGDLMAPMWRRAGIAIALTASLCLFVTATPAFSAYLVRLLEAQIPRNVDLNSAQAIVVLGADVRSGIPNKLGPQSLERLVLAADAYHRFHLPVAISGGPVSNRQTAVAALMKTALERYFAVPVTWSEDQSRTTYENAEYTAQLLRKADIGTVIVVTQARDLPRAMWSFARMGLRVLPWTAPRTHLAIDKVQDFLPNTRALNESFYAMHELLGGVYYRWRD